MNPRLICAPANSPMIVPGSDISRFCSLCGTRVMISPSGLDFLRTHPQAEVVCPCVVHMHGSVTTMIVPRADVAADLKAAVPNLWRERN